MLPGNVVHVAFPLGQYDIAREVVDLSFELKILL